MRLSTPPSFLPHNFPSMGTVTPISPPPVASPHTACSSISSFPSRLPAFVGCPADRRRRHSRLVAVSAVGDVSAEGTNYLIAGAAAVALIGTAFPIFFSRKDICPECDGAGFIRQSGAALRANAARKDQAQIVCPRCNGLGKLGQIDK